MRTTKTPTPWRKAACAAIGVALAVAPATLVLKDQPRKAAPAGASWTAHLAPTGASWTKAR